MLRETLDIQERHLEIEALRAPLITAWLEHRQRLTV